MFSQQPTPNRARVHAAREIDYHIKSFRALGDFHRQGSAPCRLTTGNDQRCVGIKHVARRARRILVGVGLLQRVDGGDGAVFRTSAPRTPATTGQPELEGDIERRAIDTGLSAGNNPTWIIYAPWIYRRLHRRTAPSQWPGRHADQPLMSEEKHPEHDQTQQRPDPADLAQGEVVATAGNGRERHV